MSADFSHPEHVTYGLFALHPWEQQPGEPDSAFQSFCTYRDLGPRRSLMEAKSIRAAMREHSVTRRSDSSLGRWSVTYRWVERARAWDAFLDAQARDAQVEAVREMAGRHARAAAAILDGLALPAEALAHKLDADPDLIKELQELPVKKLIDLIVYTARAFPTVAQVERISRGAPAMAVELSGPGGGPIELEGPVDATTERLATVISILGRVGRLALPAPEAAADPGPDAEVV